MNKCFILIQESLNPLYTPSPLLPSVSLIPSQPPINPLSLTPTDPGFCNTNLRMIHVTIDMSLPANQNPKPELEENEFIEVFTVPLKNFWKECQNLVEQGYAMDARVATIAEGMEIARQFSLWSV
jgi:hypothetical protein